MSQSLVNEGAGARTPLSGALGAGIILMVVIFFSHLLSSLPQAGAGGECSWPLPACSSSPLSRSFGGRSRRVCRRNGGALGRAHLGLASRRFDRCNHFVSPIVACCFASSCRFARQNSGTRRFSDRERNPGNESVPGILILRPESGYFISTSIMCARPSWPIHAQEAPPRLVVLDLSAAPRVDLQSAHALGDWRTNQFQRHSFPSRQRAFFGP